MESGMDHPAVKAGGLAAHRIVLLHRGYGEAPEGEFAGDSAANDSPAAYDANVKHHSPWKKAQAKRILCSREL
jgi:hypothetical protein